MSLAPDGRTLVALDTSVLLNFLRIGRLDLISNNPEWRFVVTTHVVNEVTDVDQRAQVATAISEGLVDEVTITDHVELTRLVDLNTTLGLGESAAIAIAESRSWIVAMDEGGRARRAVREGPCKGRLLTTPGILLRLIQIGVLTVAEADQLKADLEVQRFKMSFSTFADLV